MGAEVGIIGWHGRWYRRIKNLIMGDNYYVKTFSGVPNPPDEQIKKVRTCAYFTLNRICDRPAACIMYDARTAQTWDIDCCRAVQLML